MFSLQDVQHIGAAVIRVTIGDSIPVSKDSRGPNDVLNPLNWMLVGSEQVVITVVRTVSGDPHLYDLVAETPLDTNGWRLAALDIRDVDGNSLLGQVISFDGVDAQNFFSDPRDQLSAEDVVRQSMQVTSGPGWRAMIAALGRGDQIVRETSEAAFAQMFLATAGGAYLERLTTSYGINRPPNVGFGDDPLRSLTIALNANKVVGVALEAVLEAFYGVDATRVFMTASKPEPYVLAVNDELMLSVDGDTETLRIDTTQDFKNIATATAREVSVTLTRALGNLGLLAYATPFVDPQTGLNYVRIYSGIPGFRGKLQFLGGRVWDALGLPSDPGTTQAAGTQWSLTPSVPFNGVLPGRARLTWTGGPDPTLSNVFSGDYVNIFGSPFLEGNQGIFKIVDTTIDWVEYEIDVDAPPTAQTVTQVGDRDVFFTKPTIATADPRLFAAVARCSPEHADILLPATTTAVTRALDTAWYINGAESVNLTSMTRTQGSQTVTVTTATPHGLVANDLFFLDSVLLDYTWTLPAAVVSVPAAFPGTHVDFTIRLNNGHVLAVDDSNPKQYTVYNPDTNLWTTSASTGITTDGSGSQAGATLMSDGRVFVVNRSETKIYDPDANVWVTAAAPPRDKYFPQQGVIRLRDNRILVVAGDFTTGSLWSDVYDPTTNTWGDPRQLGSSEATYDGMAVITPSGNVFYGGGFPTTAHAFFYNAEQKTWVQIGNMPQALYAGRAVFIPRGPGGSVWVTGNANGPSLNSLYVLDLTTMTWTTRSTLQSYTAGDITLLGNEVVLMGRGSTNWEVHDWTLPAAIGSRTIAGTSTASTAQFWLTTLEDKSIVSVIGLGVAGQRYRFYAPQLERGAARVGGQERVTSLLSPTQFTFTTTDTTAFQATTGIVTPFEPSTSIRSGYVFDITSGVALASGFSTLTTATQQGPTQSILNVADTSTFPDEPGFVVINYGFATQSQPLRYLGVASPTQLRLAAGQIVASGYDVGTTVSLLIGTGPFAPASGIGLGTAYLTSSSVGRIEASTNLDFVKASGLDITKIVLYPGDYGLGNAGFPDSGAQKISDAVVVWGSDDVDADLAAARES